jgi:hypothetical protein
MSALSNVRCIQQAILAGPGEVEMDDNDNYSSNRVQTS